MKLLIDGDIIAYTAATKAETPVNWGDGLWTLHAFEQDVESDIDEAVSKLVTSSICTEVVTALSDASNFRKQVDPTYKANRKNIRRPMLLQYAKDYMYEKYNGVIWENLEADDVLGIMGTEDDDTLIWSLDKDLKTIPGKHLIDGEVVTISPLEGDYWFYSQTLIGDLTDNYSGCPKVGAKTAEKILAHDCSWNAVVVAYMKAGLSEEVALTQARLARILRTGEYNKETGEVTLWTPPNGSN
jgi:hypothetical protein